MDFLQIWGGFFYLLNKIFFSRSERSAGEKRRKWRIASWVVYLVGLPAVVPMLLIKEDYIFAMFEVGGAPAMVLGLIIALRGKGRAPKWLHAIAVTSIVGGLGWSIYELEGITRLTQLIEIGAVLGFLIGTYQLAREQATGYLWYVLMHLS